MALSAGLTLRTPCVNNYIENRYRVIAFSVAIGVVTAGAILSLSGGQAEARRATVMVNESANPQIQQLFNVYQKSGQDVATIHKAADAVRDFYRKGVIISGADYQLGSKLLLKSDRADDVLLSHDLAIGGIVQGDIESRRLVAESEDKYLILLGKAQRFGTQSEEGKGGASSKDLASKHLRQLLVSRSPALEIAEPTMATALVD